MKWKTKNKIALALLIPDRFDYAFLPLSKILGNEITEILISLNVVWQLETISSCIDYEKNDLYIYIYGLNPLTNRGEIKKKLHSVKVLFRKKPLSEISMEKMESILHELSNKHIKSVVWNLESPLIQKSHISMAIEPGVLLNIISCEGRPILKSREALNPHQIKSTAEEKIILPAFYDLHSMSDIIRHMGFSDDYSKKTQELTGKLDLIRQILQSG